MSAERPSHVRAVLVGGQVLDLYNPTVVVNDLVGHAARGGAGAGRDLHGRLHTVGISGSNSPQTKPTT